MESTGFCLATHWARSEHSSSGNQSIQYCPCHIRGWYPTKLDMACHSQQYGADLGVHQELVQYNPMSITVSMHALTLTMMYMYMCRLRGCCSVKNGHGVPRRIADEEIWVCNKRVTHSRSSCPYTISMPVLMWVVSACAEREGAVPLQRTRRAPADSQRGDLGVQQELHAVHSHVHIRPPGLGRLPCHLRL